MNQSERLRNSIMHINKMMHRHEPIMAIPKSEFIILKIISNNENIKISDISNKLGITNAAVSQMITSLESKNLVVRQLCKTDRRISYVSLTNEGIKTLKDTKETMDKFMNALVNKLGSNDSEELIRILNKLESLLEDGGVCREIIN